MKTYLVGGAVRDKLLNYPVIDRDWVVVGADAKHMLALGYTPVGSDFPVFLHPKTKEEYALARTERKNGKGYKGFSFYADKDVTLEQDLSRRDLTINAIAEDASGQLTDPFNGQQDLQRKILRHVSPAFSEDPLRVLRVARFGARYAHLGFSVAAQTISLMQTISLSGELEHLTRERVWQELERALTEQSPLVFFQILNDAQAQDILFPALEQVLDNIAKISAKLGSDFSAQLNQLASAQERLAWLFNVAQTDNNFDDIKTNADSFCQQLRCPNQVRNLIQHSVLGLPIISNWPNSDAVDKLAFIQTADLLRSPDKTAPLLAVFQALDYLGTCSELNYFEKLQTLLQKLRAIDHKTLILEGFKGAQLGAEIKRIQLQYCAES
ncbi:MAG: hypothetical protein HRU06_09585 [Oceanospirillaceae bacterium]|nr:hypothetical protein [Oceanospirillaceae bacterium]